MSLLVIDVSRWQGRVDWQRVKDSGVVAAIAKATEGWGYIDPEWERNRAGMLGVGIVPGAYHFARPDLGSAPEAEADWFLDVVQPGPGWILAQDAESNGGSAAWCDRFQARIFERLGYRAWFYSYWVWMYRRDILSSSIIGRDPLWLAWPDANGPLPLAVACQQYGIDYVPGIAGLVDVNRFFGDIDQLRRLTVGGEEEDMTDEEHAWLQETRGKLNQIWEQYSRDPVEKAGANVGDLIVAIKQKMDALQQPAVDASAVAVALAANLDFLAAVAKATVDELARRAVE